MDHKEAVSIPCIGHQDISTLVSPSALDLIGPNPIIFLCEHKKSGTKYAYLLKQGRWILLHRYLLQVEDPDTVVDHINRDSLDNRFENLRLCTRSQNQQNRRKPQSKRPDRIFTSIYKGDRRKATNKWEAQICINGRNKYLGIYQKEEGAAIAYNQAAKQLFGEYANLNELKT